MSLSLVIKHLQGQHSQSTHAPKSGKTAPKDKPYKVYENINDIEDLEKYYDLEVNCGNYCDAIKSYTSGGGYKSVNGYLRNGDNYNFWDVDEKDKTKQTISNLDKAFASENVPKVPENMIVNRGVPITLMAELKPGVVFKDKGFVSTSLSEKVASSFEPTYVKIKVPKGSKGIYIAGISEKSYEKELLLPRDSKFRVLGEPVRTDYGTMIEVELLED